MRLADFEQRVWEVEDIRILVRGDEYVVVENYSYENAAIETWSIAKLLEKRIDPCVGGRKVDLG